MIVAAVEALALPYGLAVFVNGACDGHGVSAPGADDRSFPAHSPFAACLFIFLHFGYSPHYKNIIFCSLTASYKFLHRLAAAEIGGQTDLSVLTALDKLDKKLHAYLGKLLCGADGRHERRDEIL